MYLYFKNSFPNSSIDLWGTALIYGSVWCYCPLGYYLFHYEGGVELTWRHGRDCYRNSISAELPGNVKQNIVVPLFIVVLQY